MKRLAILTSGGDAPGMNTAIRAIYNKASKSKIEVIGIAYGFQGILDESFINLNEINIESIISVGGTILYSSRFSAFLESNIQEKAINVLNKHKIDGLIVIGGNGSYKGAEALSNKGFPVIAIPASIDNDIPNTDYTIGFDTAINTVTKALDKIRDTASSHTMTFIIEVMGRKSGDIALWSGISSGADFILIPENSNNIKDLAKKINQSKNREKTHSLIILAEGVMSANELAKQLNQFGIFHTRQINLGHVVRGGKPSAFDRVLASKYGSLAVDLFINKLFGVCICTQSNQLIFTDITKILITHHQADKSLYDINKSISF